MKQNAKRHFNSNVRNNRKPEGTRNTNTKLLYDAATTFLKMNGYDRNGQPLRTMDNFYK